MRLLGPGRGRRLLDLGAAEGQLSRRLSEEGWRVTAIERDAARAAAGAGSCECVVVADLDRATPELEGRFDAIVYGDVLEHLADPLAALIALNRFLATDGDVVISVPNVAHLWIRLSLLLGRFDYTERVSSTAATFGSSPSAPSGRSSRTPGFVSITWTARRRRCPRSCHQP